MEASETNVLELIRAICRIHRSRPNNAYYAIDILNDQDFEDVSIEFVEAIYKQLETQADELTKTHRENAESKFYYMFFEVPGSHKSVAFLSERYFLLYDLRFYRSNVHKLELFDLLNDTSVEFSITKSADCLSSIYPLFGKFGLFVERRDFEGLNSLYRISLIALDFYDVSCEKLQLIEYRCEDVEIFVNKFDASDFVLQLLINDGHVARVCKLVNESIVVGDPIQLPCDFQSYFGGLLYCIESFDNDDWTDKCQIAIYSIEQGIHDEFEVALPDGYYMTYDDFHLVDWIDHKVLVPIGLVHGATVIACLDVHTRQWTILEFGVKMIIYQIRFFNNSDLLIHTKKDNVHTFFKLSIHKPDFLQHMAWHALVKAMEKKKRDTSMGPHEAARRYLPYNLQIRCPFVEIKADEKSKPAEKCLKLM